ncbi:uncharacterized protein LOC125669368 isoform X2 [Ostrea edulis]|uniref:uncharacterized protein LOC125669368 isoform X2 n=1 Tax=Ostrea edulis TaxID=37623 RepID=UPI0024AEF177|nr:uncharacterized protein LOC125669368 isoform X2 [Ostrea edulis]
MTTHAYMREGFGTVTFDTGQNQTDSRKFGGVMSDRMSMYLDNTAVIKLTHNNNLLLNEKKIQSRENTVYKSETDNIVINSLKDSHFRLLTAESNVRPTSSNISDRIDLGVTNPIVSQPTTPNAEVGEEGPDAAPQLQNEQLDSYNINSKSSSRKGKRKKRAKSSRGLRSKSTQGKDGGASKQRIPTATTVKTGVKQNDTQNMTTGAAGLGVLESMCKPMVLHKTSERKNSEKRETTKTVSSGNRSLTNTKHLSLPQMTNNFMVKTDSSVRTSNSENFQNSKSFVYPSSRINHAEIARITKIYLSEKQSGIVKDCGMEVPCAPPATPLPDPSKKVEYIPSMNDIRAQRAVKVKLQVLEKEAQKKSAKRREDQAKQEKHQLKEREKDLRVKQRIEIYALNKIMTDLENKRFMEFCEKKGISTT